MRDNTGPVPFLQRHKLPLGAQLFPLIPELTVDFEDTLTKLAEIGFTFVEMSSFHGKDPRELRQALDRAGLTCSGVHIVGRPMGSTDSLSGDMSALVEKLQIVGAPAVFMPIFNFPENAELRPAAGEDLVAVIRRVGNAMTADDWRRNADFLNEKGAILKDAGIQLGYHNHNFEFAPIGRTFGLEILLENTEPDLVAFELDTGWASASHVDPAALVQRYRGRFQFVHLKDVKPTTPHNYALDIEPTEIGSGKVDWHMFLTAAYGAGARCFIVEQEAPFERPALQSMRINFDFLASV